MAMASDGQVAIQKVCRVVASSDENAGQATRPFTTASGGQTVTVAGGGENGVMRLGLAPGSNVRQAVPGGSRLARPMPVSATNEVEGVQARATGSQAKGLRSRGTTRCRSSGAETRSIGGPVTSPRPVPLGTTKRALSRETRRVA